MTIVPRAAGDRRAPEVFAAAEHARIGKAMGPVAAQPDLREVAAPLRNGGPRADRVTRRYDVPDAPDRKVVLRISLGPDQVARTITMSMLPSDLPSPESPSSLAADVPFTFSFSEAPA